MSKIIYRGASYRKVTASEIRKAEDAAARDEALTLLEKLVAGVKAAYKGAGAEFNDVFKLLKDLALKVADHKPAAQAWSMLYAKVQALAPLQLKPVQDFVAMAKQLNDNAAFQALLKAEEAEAAKTQKQEKSDMFGDLNEQLKGFA